MFFNKRFEYCPLQQVTLPSGSRYYLDPNTGRKLTSVTTILKYTSYKPELEEWKRSVGAEKAKQISEEAIALGKLLHSYLECHVLEIDRPVGNNYVHQLARRMADTVIANGLSRVEEVWGMENSIYYPGLYAGTLDLVGTYQGKPAIMDYKTANRLRTKEQIGDYFEQTSAYALAHNILHGTDISTLVIFMVTRDLQFNTFVIEQDEFNDIAMRWSVRVERYLA